MASYSTITKSVDNMGTWADKVNATMNHVGYIISSGVATFYTDLDELFTSLTDGDKAIIAPGSHTLTGNYSLTNTTDLSIVCADGIADITMTIAGVADASALEFTGSSNITLRNINFILDLNTADYGSGHAYNVTLNAASGIVENCGFLLDSDLSDTTMVSPNHSIAFVQLPENPTAHYGPVIKDCWFATFNSNASPSTTQIVAIHDSGGDNGTYAPKFISCNFIANQSLFASPIDIIAGQGRFYSCRTTAYTMRAPEVLALSHSEAVTFLPDSYKSKLSSSDTYNYASGQSDGWTQIFSESGVANDWYDVIKILSDPSRNATEKYQLEVTGSVSGSGLNEGLVSFSVLTLDGTAVSHTNYEYLQYGTRSRIVSDGTNLVFQISPGATGSSVTFEGKFRLIPTQRYYNGLTYGANVYPSIVESN